LHTLTLHLLLSFCFLLIPPPPPSTLFPYTTLFRSVLRHIRTVNPDQQVIIYSAACDPKTEQQVLALGITEVVKKSCSLDHLEEADRKSTRLNSSHVAISYAVFCLKKKKKK